MNFTKQSTTTASETTYETGRRLFRMLLLLIVDKVQHLLVIAEINTC